MIELTATNVVVVITATEAVNTITVSVDEISFGVNSVETIFSITNTVNDITFFSDGIGGFDFVEQYKGTWVSGTEYLRNDTVDYLNSKYICAVPFRTVFTSTIVPPQDTTNWELFMFNEATMAYLTVTTTATIGGRVSIGGNTTIGGTLAVSNSTTLNNNLTVSGNTVVNGRLNIGQSVNIVGETTITDNLDVIGPLYVQGSANIAGTHIYGNTISAADHIESTGTSTFYDLTVQRQFQIGNLKYPLGAGDNGQILLTNGSNQASWANLGDVVVWNLSDDLQTNGFYILTGANDYGDFANPELRIASGDREAGYKSWIWIKEVAQTSTRGDIDVRAATLSISNTVTIGNNLTVGGSITANTFNISELNLTNLDVAGTATFTVGTVDLRNRQIRFHSTGTYSFVNSTLVGRNFDTGVPQPISVSPGFIFNDGSVLTSANIGTGSGQVSLVTATITRLGGILVGSYLSITGDGRLSVDADQLPKAGYSTFGIVKVGDYLQINSTTNALEVNTATLPGAYTLPIASTTTLGGIKVGQFLDINPSTGVLDVNTASIGQVSYSLPVATTSTLGGIKVGDYLDINTETGVLSVNTLSIGQATYTLPVATASVLGGVKVGSTLNINTETGVLNADTATTANVGVVQIGSGLSVTAAGLISVDTSTRVSLSEHMVTNGFEIRRTNVATSAKLDLETTNTVLQASNDSRLNLYATTASIKVDDRIDLRAPSVRIGDIITDSNLLVSRIYNYSGVGPPFFPAGIQFGDQSVQLTAYYGNDFGPVQATSDYGIEQQARVVDFNNRTLSVDYNLI
jgi:hypothetical protein